MRGYDRISEGPSLGGANGQVWSRRETKREREREGEIREHTSITTVRHKIAISGLLPHLSTCELAAHAFPLAAFFAHAAAASAASAAAATAATGVQNEEAGVRTFFRSARAGQAQVDETQRRCVSYWARCAPHVFETWSTHDHVPFHAAFGPCSVHCLE